MCTTEFPVCTYKDIVIIYFIGKLTGIVTTTRITHATPACGYAHSAHREWEFVTADDGCEDIATQLINGDVGRQLRVRSCSSYVVYTIFQIVDQFEFCSFNNTHVMCKIIGRNRDFNYTIIGSMKLAI